jgi:predicted DNA-binding transcriptional regulator AlpA
MVTKFIVAIVVAFIVTLVAVSLVPAAPVSVDPILGVAAIVSAAPAAWINELDPSLNARSVALFEGISVVTLNRLIREGKFPQADYLRGPYRFWKRSTVICARERRIAESAHRVAEQRAAQLDAAARARGAQRRKRAAASPDTAALKAARRSER